MAVVVRWKLILALGAIAAAGSDKPAFVLQNTPERGEPFEHSPLKVNPPTFRWPPAKSAAEYEIQLTRSEELREPLTVNARETFYRPREPLAPGRSTRPRLPVTAAVQPSYGLRRWPGCAWPGAG